MLKVAVIGIGKMGQRHLEKWSQIGGCKIVGIVGRNPDKVTDLGLTYNAQPFTSLEDLVNAVEVDVVDICLPTHLHFEFIKQAAEAKKQIICEKPLALNAVEAKAIIEICEKQNVQLFVGQTLRFSSEYAQAHQQVKRGAIGKPGVIRLSRGTAYPNGSDSWYTDANKSGGILLDLGIHDFDWLIWTFGDVKKVFAKHIKKQVNSGRVLDYALVTLRMKDGAIAHVELSWAKNALEASFELAGDKGMIISNQDRSPIKVTLKDEFNETGALVNNPIGESPILQQLRHFKECITDGKTPLVTPEDALKAIEVAEAAIRSASTGQPVNLIERGA
ncbi:hypothetical protein WQ54_27785 [Bacillus sp. SA1-12]|uniref:Gfo/Idh/MocA family protein n=1 Tax=Bacillus sp. SA1-12 TaxID=1455638 RepID=UPI0006270341|nr:Gfo/Idh/MocA family oxidoreductase [Bacillus sp. SA1-12]KKI89034.1 hypothetical protein WQ54_27785 [Bacillus sp. SA1-12]